MNKPMQKLLTELDELLDDIELKKTQLVNTVKQFDELGERVQEMPGRLLRLSSKSDADHEELHDEVKKRLERISGFGIVFAFNEVKPGGEDLVVRFGAPVVMDGMVARLKGLGLAQSTGPQRASGFARELMNKILGDE